MRMSLVPCLIVSLLLASTSLSLAQTNSSKAPILPPPPTSALEPIAVPAATPTPVTMTPVAHLDGSSTTQSTTTSETKATPARRIIRRISANPVLLPPTAQEMGNVTPPVTSTSVTTTTQNTNGNPALAAVPPVTTTTAGKQTTTVTTQSGPIALPGMPTTESALNTSTAATTTIDPNLVGAGANPGYDEAAYEERLKKRLADIKTETRDQSLTNATQATFPMQPNEIEDVIRQLRKTQAAIQKPVEVPPPTPRAVVHTMELDPGAQPPTIQLLNGNVTSLSILDATGQPWPIVDIAFGGAFDVKPPEAGGHIIRISPLKEYARGNMSVRLQKLATPLTFVLDSGGQEVHYRFDARVPQLGPNAKASLINRGMTIQAGDDSDLSAILVGTPPSSAERLKVSGVDGRTSAYRLGGFTYVRTPHTLLSPTWESSVSSADGTNVYKLPEAPVLLLSDNGTMVRAQIQQPVIDPFALPDDQKALPAQDATTRLGDHG